MSDRLTNKRLEQVTNSIVIALTGQDDVDVHKREKMLINIIGIAESLKDKNDEAVCLFTIFSMASYLKEVNATEGNSNTIRFPLSDGTLLQVNIANPPTASRFITKLGIRVLLLSVFAYSVLFLAGLK